MPDFSVPRWLEPPNEVEQARINEATAAAQQKAGTMIRRQIGLRRMQAEAAAAQQNGVDPVTARQNALINNAHLLFSDNPEAVSNLVNHQEANQVREQANAQLALYRDAQIQAREHAINQTQEKLDQQKDFQQKLLDARDREFEGRQDNETLKRTIEALRVKGEIDAKTAASELAAQKAEDARNKLSPAALEGKDVANLRAQLRDAQSELANSGVGVLKPEVTKPLRDKILNLEDQIQQIDARRNIEEISVEPGASGPSVRITRGGKSSVPTAVQTELQKQIASGANTMSTISQTLPSINPSTVGPGGIIKENLETLANIINPGSVKPETTTARELMKIGTQEITSAMKQPGMVSNYERRMLADIGDITGFYEAAPNARAKMETLRSLLAAKAVRNSKTLRQPPPQQALMYLPLDLEQELVKEGNFSVEDAKRWYAIHKAMETQSK